MAATNDLRPHPPSARAAPAKPTRLTTVAQLRDALRFGGHDDVSEIVVSECGADPFNGDLVLRVVSLPAITSSLRVLDLSFNNLPDSFWTQAEWTEAPPRWPSLTHMNLANNRFTEDSLVVLQDVVARCPELKHLDLSLNALGYNLVKRASNTPPPSICDLLLTTSIETLDLSCLHLSDTHVDVLLESPSLTLSIRRLYLRSNDLSDAAAVAFANAIGSHRLVALQVLSLAGNGIGDHGLGALAFVLDMAAALETLDLDDNMFSGTGLQTLYHVINSLSQRFTLRFLHLNRSNSSRQDARLVDVIQLKLQEKLLETHVTAGPPPDHHRALCLSGRHVRSTLHMASALTDHFVDVALTAIRHCDHTWAALEELDLSGNAIGTPGAWAIGSFLSLLPPKLRVLNLSDNAINDESIAGLADGLEWNAALAELNLNENEITDDGAKQLYLKAFTSNLQRKILLSEGNPLTSECKVMVAAISQAYDLRKRFAKEFAPLETLNLEGHRLRQYGAAAIAECLLTTPSAKCTSIDLSNNMLGDEGAVEAVSLLRGYAPLTKLDLSFNDIGDRGALALADALRANASLTSLSLHSSIPGSASSVKPRLTEIGLMAMVRALETHPTLAVLDLRDNVVSTALTGALVQTLQRNPRIVKFNGSSAAVFLARNEL